MGFDPFACLCGGGQTLSYGLSMVMPVVNITNSIDHEIRPAFDGCRSFDGCP